MDKKRSSEQRENEERKRRRKHQEELHAILGKMLAKQTLPQKKC